jgi:hypothetical protein
MMPITQHLRASLRTRLMRVYHDRNPAPHTVVIGEMPIKRFLILGDDRAIRDFIDLVTPAGTAAPAASRTGA